MYQCPPTHSTNTHNWWCPLTSPESTQDCHLPPSLESYTQMRWLGVGPNIRVRGRVGYQVLCLIGGWWDPSHKRKITYSTSFMFFPEWVFLQLEVVLNNQHHQETHTSHLQVGYQLPWPVKPSRWCGADIAVWLLSTSLSIHIGGVRFFWLRHAHSNVV